MYKIVLLATAVSVSSPALAAEVSASATAQEGQSTALADPQQRAQAIQDIQEMKARIARMESSLGLPSATPPVQFVPPLPREPKDHNLELYGFIHLDAIQDFNRVNPDWDATL